LIEGPCCVVDHILSLTRQSNIVQLVSKLTPHLQTEMPMACGGATLLELVKAPVESNFPPILACPRVGLTLKRDLPLGTSFVMKCYRYVSWPHVGILAKGKPNLYMGLHLSGLGAEEIIRIMGSRASQSVRNALLEIGDGTKMEVCTLVSPFVRNGQKLRLSSYGLSAIHVARHQSGFVVAGVQVPSPEPEYQTIMPALWCMDGCKQMTTTGG
jgi:hypothetical protein